MRSDERRKNEMRGPFRALLRRSVVMFGNSHLKKAFLPVFLVLLLLALQVSATLFDIPGPGGSDEFGSDITVLPNGNFVVVDPFHDIPGAADVGAVYLYDGQTLNLISVLTGSTANDRVGSSGILVLTDRRYTVISQTWSGGRGAVTHCENTTGCNGPVTESNSMVGANPGDNVGNGGAEKLTTGGIVIISFDWFDPVTGARVGAATYCAPTAPCIGPVSPSNSLTGMSAGDSDGRYVVALDLGAYAVGSPNHDNSSAPISDVVGSQNRDNSALLISDVGAVTWCSGTTGCTGPVTASNSLIGGTQNDRVGGTGITALSDGSYVVKSTGWDNPSPLIADVGAATYCSAASPCTGLVTASNSLIGGTATDWVGNGVTALNDGNYVVSSPIWDNPSPMLQDAGAATFCSSTTPCSGLVTASNSLVGSTAFEQVGNFGVTALTNGNYVIATPQWDNPSPVRMEAGAATFCTAAAPCTGPINSTNSLTGGRANDQVGIGRVTALTNGNYVVGSPFWANPSLGGSNSAGAATWGNGTTGTVGSITATNSLIGGGSDNNVGSGVTALTNGNYVVRSPFWDNSSPFVQDVGAVTWCDGTGVTVGVVTASNSLIGSRPFDNAGTTGVTALTNGNYVVASRLWDNPSPVIADVGAVTWGNGTGGTVGPITVSNSLIGGTANDNVGNGAIGGAGPITALPGGNYAVTSTNWDNPSPVIVNATAVSFGNGVSGTSGLVSSANSVLGTVAGGTNTFSYDALRNRLFVGRAASNIVSILFFNTTATTDGDLTSAATWDSGVPNGYTNGIIPNGRIVTLTSRSTVGLLSVGCTGAIAGASSSAYIIGSAEKDYCAAANETFLYPVGDAGDYSPMTASNVNGTGSLLVKAVDATLPGLNPAQSASRFWRLSGTGITTDLSFTYVDADINGTEASYKVFRRSGGVSTQVTPFSLNTGTNTITATGVSSFSDWGVGNGLNLVRTKFDFDGDGRTDISIFRPTPGEWWVSRSSDGSHFAAQFGASTDRIAPADYDGDGKTDIAVWREAPATQAAFYILNSSNSTVRVEFFGQTGDIPQAGDYDGDGKADVSVYRNEAQSIFFFRASFNNPNGDVTYRPWGLNGDVPVTGDYDGDGKTDAAVFRPSDRVWYVLRSSNVTLQAVQFGLTTDKLVPSDYDGDGKTDVAIYRDGAWWILNSGATSVSVTAWGLAGDTPVPGDYDGDGKTDVAIFRNAAWFVNRSTAGTLIQQFGLTGDRPVPSAFVP
ncbi:MAG: FG-GAP-like repeat-containing protein [Pyrinomonadaceae bacterium]